MGRTCLGLWCLFALAIGASSQKPSFRPSKSHYRPEINPFLRGVSYHFNQLPRPDPLSKNTSLHASTLLVPWRSAPAEAPRGLPNGHEGCASGSVTSLSQQIFFHYSRFSRRKGGTPAKRRTSRGAQLLRAQAAAAVPKRDQVFSRVGLPEPSSDLLIPRTMM